MNRIARYATLLVVLAAGLLLVACGGDESEDRPAAEAALDRFANEFPPLNNRIAEVGAEVRNNPARRAPPAPAAGREPRRRRGRGGRAPARGGGPARTRDALTATGRRGGGDPRRSQGAGADVRRRQRQPPAAGAAQRPYRACRSLAGSQPHAEHAGGGDARCGELGLGAGSAWRTPLPTRLRLGQGAAHADRGSVYDGDQQRGGAKHSDEGIGGRGVERRIYGVPVLLSSQLSIAETQGTAENASSAYVYQPRGRDGPAPGRPRRGRPLASFQCLAASQKLIRGRNVLGRR